MADRPGDRCGWTRRFCGRAVLPLLVCLSGCTNDTPAPAETDAAAQPMVATSFYPTAYFVQRIAGDTVEVVCPVPEEADPLHWQPTRDDVRLLQSADLIVLNGAGMERWAETASLPPTRIVDTSAGFSDEFITVETTTHSHGPAGEHTHEGVDSHTWLDPINTARQAAAVRDALARRFPQHSGVYGANYAELSADLDALDERLRALSPSAAGVQLVASHPAYNYVARRYGWRVTNLDLDPEAALTDEQWSDVAAAVSEGAMSVMLWESPPLETTRRRLEEEGIVSVVFSPCEMLSVEERAQGIDYLRVMHGNIDRLAAALGGSG